MKGIFRGIVDNFAIIEFPCTVSDGAGGIRWITQITRQPIRGKIHSCNFGFGYQPRNRWMYPVVPDIGQEVEYESETPDMAGHLVAWIGPVEGKVEEVA